MAFVKCKDFDAFGLYLAHGSIRALCFKDAVHNQVAKFGTSFLLHLFCI